MSTSEDVFEIEERATTELSNAPFTDEDIKALRENDKVNFKSGPKIQIQQHIGVIGLPSGILLHVKPKESLTGFKPLYYLAKAGRISEELVVGPREIGFSTGESFIDVVAMVYDREIERLTRQGLQTRYITSTEATSHVRGQLRLSRQITNQEPLATSFESRYDELTADVPLNQLILYAGAKLVDRVGDAAIQSSLEHRVAQLNQRVSMPTIPPNPQEITLTSETQAYLPLLKLVEQILDKRYIDTFGEQSRLLQSILVNTETLFEEVVFQAIQEVVSGTRFVINGDGDPDNASDGDIGYLLENADGGRLQGLKPDVFLRDRGTPVWIADAKWREDDSPKRENLYQVTAYQRKTAAPAVMFYPEQGGSMEGIYQLTRSPHTNVWSGELSLVELPLGADSYYAFEEQLRSDISQVLAQQLESF